MFTKEESASNSDFKISAIMPADGWYFVIANSANKFEPVVWNLAAWGLTMNGEVIGLVGALGSQQGEKRASPRLVGVPPVPGEYLHKSQLTEIELAQSLKR